MRRTDAPGFVGDHFQVGAEKEVWIIDTIRTWSIPDAGDDRNATDLAIRVAN